MQQDLLGADVDDESLKRQLEYAQGSGLPELLEQLAAHLLDMCPTEPFEAIAKWALSKTKRGGATDNYFPKPPTAERKRKRPTSSVSIRCDWEGESEVSHSLGSPRGSTGVPDPTAVLVARSLVHYELDTARRAIAERAAAGPLDDLTEELGRIADQLEIYRPYLPDFMFEAASVLETNESTPPVSPSALVGDALRQALATRGRSMVCSGPQPPAGEVAIVFTDIQASSALWGQHTAAMRRALELHNRLLRRKMEDNCGYEVKTLGDAFMVAFADCLSAVKFAQETQWELLGLDWPRELLDEPVCRAVPGDTKGWLWRGLRVRMGIHFGPAQRETNPVTLREDYFGPTVNVAARVEGCAPGGGTAVTKAVLDSLQSLHEEDAARLLHPAVVPMGSRELKGCGTQELLLLLPAVLSGRADGIVPKESCPSIAMSPKDRELILSAGQRSLQPPPARRASIGKLERVPQGLKSVRATVATLRLDTACLQGHFPLGRDEAHERINFTIAAAERAAARTEGQLHTTGGPMTQLVFGWNAGRPCVTHGPQSTRFLGLLFGEEEQDSSGTLLPWRGGVASGPVVHGVCGYQKRYCTLVIGGTCDLTGILGEVADTLGVRCLRCKNPSTSGIFESFARPIDYWKLCDGTVVTVEQLHEQRLAVCSEEGIASFMCEGMSAPSVGDSDGDMCGGVIDTWGSNYRSALRDADQDPRGPVIGNTSALEALSAAVPGDTVLRAVLQMKQQKTRLVGNLRSMLLPQTGRNRSAR